MKRPRGFTILSLFLVFISVGGIAKDIHLASVYGSILGILAFIYGLSAMFAAYGLWFYRPWVFYALIVWSISVLLRIFNMQFGLNGEYTIPLHFFIPYAIILSIISISLLYYIKKKFQAQPQLDAEGHALNEAPLIKVSVFNSLCYSYLIFLFVSFINFAITIFFISRTLVPVAIFNTLLNLVPIYLLSKYLIAPTNNKKIIKSFWISTIILSVFLVIPYGAFVLDYVIYIFRIITQK